MICFLKAKKMKEKQTMSDSWMQKKGWGYKMSGRMLPDTPSEDSFTKHIF